MSQGDGLDRREIEEIDQDSSYGSQGGGQMIIMDIVIKQICIMLEADYSVEEDYDLESVEEGNKLEIRMGNFRQHLGEKLEEMGLDVSLSPPKSQDPQLIVQQQIQQLTSLLIEKTEEVIEDHLNLTELVTRNESTILKYFAGVLSMAQVMILFSKDLFASGEHISTFRNFKKLYDEFSEYSVLLNGYHAFTEEFEETRGKFMDKQEILLNKIIFKSQETEPQSERESIEKELESLKEQNQELLGVLRKYQEELSKYQAYEGENQSEVHKQNLKLMGELDKLQRILNENNQDFAIEVQRYNRLLYDEREDFKRAEMDLRNDIRVLEYSIRQAEKELGGLRDQKYKDQIMIENLIRKNRHLEKRESFQYNSPSQKLNHTSIIPNSPKRIGVNTNIYSKNI